MKKIIYILTVVICTLGACKDDNEVIKNTTYLMENIKPYMFDVNSYWVYKNVETQQLDSIYVVSVLHDTIITQPATSHDLYEHSAEIYQINMKSSIFYEEFNDIIKFRTICRNGSLSYGDYGQAIFSKDIKVGDEMGGMSIIEFIDNLEINGSVFSNITKIKITAIKQYKHIFDNDTYLYFVDGIGIVKKEIDLESGQIETWELVKSNVVLYTK